MSATVLTYQKLHKQRNRTCAFRKHHEYWTSSSECAMYRRPNYRFKYPPLSPHSTHSHSHADGILLFPSFVVLSSVFFSWLRALRIPLLGCWFSHSEQRKIDCEIRKLQTRMISKWTLFRCLLHMQFSTRHSFRFSLFFRVQQIMNNELYIHMME